jgi:hypothetical protein
MIFILSILFSILVTGSYFLLWILPFFNQISFFSLLSIPKLGMGCTLLLFFVPMLLDSLFRFLPNPTLSLATTPAIVVSQIPVFLVTILLSPLSLQKIFESEFPKLHWKIFIYFSLPIVMIPLILIPSVYVSRIDDLVLIKTNLFQAESSMKAYSIMNIEVADATKRSSSKSGSSYTYKDAVLLIDIPGRGKMELYESGMGAFSKVEHIVELAHFFCTLGIPVQNYIYPETSSQKEFSSKFNLKVKELGCKTLGETQY